MTSSPKSSAVGIASLGSWKAVKIKHRERGGRTLRAARTAKSAVPRPAPAAAGRSDTVRATEIQKRASCCCEPVLLPMKPNACACSTLLLRATAPHMQGIPTHSRARTHELQLARTTHRPCSRHTARAHSFWLPVAGHCTALHCMARNASMHSSAAAAQQETLNTSVGCMHAPGITAHSCLCTCCCFRKRLGARVRFQFTVLLCSSPDAACCLLLLLRLSHTHTVSHQTSCVTPLIEQKPIWGMQCATK